MHNEQSEDLLVIIAMQEDEPQAAQQAFNEFHRRFKDYVWKVAVSLARDIHDPNQEEITRDIFNDTFLDVFQNYAKESYFDPARCTDIEKGIKAWLSGIARNHFRRMIEAVQKASRMSYLDAFPERPFFDPDDTDKGEMADPPSMIALKRALQTLSDRDQEILLIAVQFEEEGRLPKAMKQTLCEKYGLSPDSLRQVKKRAKEKIEKYMQEHGYLTQQKSKTNV
jgi:RNA polymerase sigma factor (sigma-70 family)